MIATVQFFEVVLAVHIMAVVFAFGATFAYPVLLGTVGKADSRALPALYRAIHAISVKVIMPGLAIVVICGIYLASKLHVWSEFYVQWGIAVAVVIGAVEGMFISPNEKRLMRGRRAGSRRGRRGRSEIQRRARHAREAHRRRRRHDGPARDSHDLVHGAENLSQKPRVTNRAHVP